MTVLRVIAFLMAAGVGGALRWLIGQRVTTSGGFPLGTIAVNITGSFALGLAVGADNALFTIIGVGGLGAFTTFSTFVRDLVVEWEQRRWGRVALYLVVSLGGSIGAAFAGLSI